MHTRSKLSKVTTLKSNEENTGLIFVFLKQEKQMHNVLHFVCLTTFWALSFEKQNPENCYIKWKNIWKKQRWKSLLFHDLARVVFPPELLLSPLIIYYWQEIITEFEIVIHEAEARLKSFVTCKFDNYICAVYFSYIGEVFGFFNTKIAI